MVFDPGRTMIINETLHFRRRIAIQLSQTQSYSDEISEATLQSIALNRLRALRASSAAIAIFV